MLCLAVEEVGAFEPGRKIVLIVARVNIYCPLLSRSFSLQLKKERKVEQPMATDRSLRSSYGTLKRIFHEISPTLK